MKKIKTLTFSILFLIMIVSCNNSSPLSPISNMNISNADGVFLSKSSGKKGLEEDAYVTKLENEVIEKVKYKLEDGSETDAVVAQKYWYLNKNYFIISLRNYGDYLVNRNTGKCYPFAITTNNGVVIDVAAIEDSYGNLYFWADRFDGVKLVKVEFTENDSINVTILVNLPQDSINLQSMAVSGNGCFGYSYDRKQITYNYICSSDGKVLTSNSNANFNNYFFFSDKNGTLYYVNEETSNLYRLSFNPFEQILIGNTEGTRFQKWNADKTIFLSGTKKFDINTQTISDFDCTAPAACNWKLRHANFGSKWYYDTYIPPRFIEYDVDTNTYRTLFEGVEDDSSWGTNFNGYEIHGIRADKNGKIWITGGYAAIVDTITGEIKEQTYTVNEFYVVNE